MTKADNTGGAGTQARRYWPIVLLAVVVIVGVFAVLARNPTGPATNEGKVANAMSDTHNPAASAGGSNPGT